jgi:hypothetical protein
MWGWMGMNIGLDFLIYYLISVENGCIGIWVIGLLWDLDWCTIQWLRLLLISIFILILLWLLVLVLILVLHLCCVIQCLICLQIKLLCSKWVELSWSWLRDKSYRKWRLWLRMLLRHTKINMLLLFRLYLL